MAPSAESEGGSPGALPDQAPVQCRDRGIGATANGSECQDGSPGEEGAPYTRLDSPAGEPLPPESRGVPRLHAVAPTLEQIERVFGPFDKEPW